MAEVMKYTDFKEEGSEAACKAAGKKSSIPERRKFNQRPNVQIIYT